MVRKREGMPGVMRRKKNVARKAAVINRIVLDSFAGGPQRLSPELALAEGKLREKRGPDELKATAIHEAQHAVFRTIFGLPLDYVSSLLEITPVSQKGGKCLVAIRNGHVYSKQKPQTEVEKALYGISLLAPLAGELNSGIDPEIAKSGHCGTDFERARSMFTPDYVWWLVDCASIFLQNSQIQEAVHQLASALIEKGRVEGDEVREIAHKFMDSRMFISRPEWIALASDPNFSFAAKFKAMLGI
jgi:hypothetical protein